jgi:hypothetical protein
LAQPAQEPKCAVIIEVFGKDWRLEYMSLPVGKHKLYTQQYIYTAPQSQMQPCAGRNCGSTNPNLHSAECFEDYDKATGMNMTNEDFEPVRIRIMQEAYNLADRNDTEGYNSVKVMCSEVQNLLQRTPQNPVAWLDEYGNAFPLAAKQYSVETLEYIQGWNDCREVMPDPIHHTTSETLEYIQGWNDCRAFIVLMLEMRKP